jgi:hypothetical protein
VSTHPKCVPSDIRPKKHTSAYYVCTNQQTSHLIHFPILHLSASRQTLYEPYPGPPGPPVPPIPNHPLPGQKPGTTIGYALGIVVFQHETLGKVYFHSGSNTMNTAIFLIAPEKHIASVIMTNAAKPDPQDTLISQALALASQYATK